MKTMRFISVLMLLNVSSLFAMQEPTKLTNVGNSCFMNAVLQSLYSLDELTELLFNKQQYYVKNSPADAYIDFINFAKGSAGELITPQIICDHGWNILAQTRFTPQDSDEFLLGLLDRLTGDDITDQYKKWLPFYENSARCMTDISQLFYVRVNSMITVPSENYQGAIKTEPVAALSLPIASGDLTLIQCIHRFFEGEKVEQYALPSGKRVTADKKLSLEETQKYLIMSLKRNDQGQRHDDHIAFPVRNLKLGCYFDDPAKNKSSYDLKAVIMHGGDVKGGHYTAYIKLGDQWYYCNDAVVTALSEEEVEAIAERGYGANETIVPTTLFYEMSPRTPIIPWRSGIFTYGAWPNSCLFQWTENPVLPKE